MKIVNSHCDQDPVGNKIKWQNRPENSTYFWHYRSYRLYLVLIMELVVLANALVRTTLSIAMVCIVNSTQTTAAPVSEISASNETQALSECVGANTAYDDYGGTEIWTSSEQSFLFSAVFWGGILPCIPAGLLADQCSPKLLVVCCFVLQALGCFLCPIAAIQGGVLPLFIVRFVMGAGGQVVFNVAMSVLVTRFIPPDERSTAIGMYSGGNQVAMMISMPLNAWLCKQKWLIGGWPSIFYMNGIITCLCAIPWLIFVADTPEHCRWLSKHEFKYIQKSLRFQNLGNMKGLNDRVPWVKMLSSMALWSCIIGNFAACIMIVTLEAYIPTYFKQALNLNLKSNGMLSALPHIALWASKILFAIAADLLKTRTSLSHTWICRIFNSLSTFAAGAFLLACGYVNCEYKVVAVLFLVLANFFSAGQVPGFFTSLACLAPAYTGIINALTRLSGQLASVLAPYIVGAITVEGTVAEWRSVYYITASTLFATGVHFLIFGTAKIQPWASINDKAIISLKSMDEKNSRISPTALSMNEDNKISSMLIINHEEEDKTDIAVV